jgi:hypothetical protein
MEKGSDGLRARLLARLPQPENRHIYREEIGVLMAKHERALDWERATARMVAFAGILLFILTNNVALSSRLDTHGVALLDGVSVVLFFAGAMMMVGYSISRGKVDLLKEVKQVQLQILELQASLHKEGDR